MIRAGTMKGRSQKYDRRSRISFDSDRLRAVVTLPAIVAPRPDQRGPIFGRERRNRPHHVDEIFELPGRTAPHVLVPVRKLRWRARMQLERLREVELDGVAPRLEDSVDEAHDGRVLDKEIGRAHV